MLEISLILVCVLIVYIAYMKTALRINDTKLMYWRNKALTLNNSNRILKEELDRYEWG